MSTLQLARQRRQWIPCIAIRSLPFYLTFGVIVKGQSSAL